MFFSFRYFSVHVVNILKYKLILQYKILFYVQLWKFVYMNMCVLIPIFTV